MASLQSLITIQEAFIAYYQRPGDPTGLRYWADRLEAPGGDIQQVLAAFGNSPESLALYGPINSSTIGNVIDEIYLGLFGRLPDAAGKAFYIAGFNAGTFTAASIAYNILVGAQNDDAVAIQNKVIAANEFSETVDGRPLADPAFGTGTFFNVTYAGDADADAARAWLGAVDSNPASIPSPAQTTSFIQNAIANTGDAILGTPGGVFKTLTTNTDVIQITNPAEVDTILGIVSANPTFSVGDLIIGNNQTTLKLTVASGGTGTADLVTMANVKAIDIQAGMGNWVTFDAIGWTNIGSVNLVGGTPGLDVIVENIGPQTGFSINGATSGSVELNYTDGTNVWGYSEKGGSLTWDPATGSVIGAAAADMSVSFSAWATTNGGDITIGNVSMVGNGADEAYFGAYHTWNGPGGDVTVGDISISGFTYIYVDVSASSYTADSQNVTVGNVNVKTSGGSADAYVYIGNSSDQVGDDFPAGDVTAGNLLGTVGKAGYLYFDIWDEGYGGAGDLTIGNVNQNVGQSGDAYLYVTHSGWWSTAGDAISVGTTTVGNIQVNVGVDGYGYADIYNWVSASGATAELGQITVGNVELNANVDSTQYFYVTASATASGGGAAIIDGLTMGNVTVNANDGAYVYGYPIYAYNNSTGGSIGDIEQGNVTVTAGVQATVTLYNDVTAYGTDTSIGNFTQGDVTINTNTSADVWVSDYLYASNGDIGDVNIGNISVNAVKSADAGFGLYEYGNNVGDWDIGNVTITSNGVNAYASVSMSWTATDTMGPSDVGNVTMQVKGAGADGYFYFYAAAPDVGTQSFGNFDLNVGNDAKKISALLDVYISNTASDVVIGDIKLTGATVRGATDITQTYDALFYAHAGGDLDVGNITVTGGDGKADNFATLSGWLTLTAGGDVTIDSVDYSGYGASATIDVSGFKSVAVIKGGSKADTITDNKGTNTITGNGGADTFTFVTTNTGKTLATADKITDFSEAGGDRIDVAFTVTPPGVTEYGEGDYADFNAFNSAANAGNKEVWVGNITGTGLVAAIDYNNDGTVDFMIQLVGLNNLNQIDVNAFI